MGMSRAEYMRKKPWKSAPKKMSRSQFEDMVRELGHEFFRDLKEYADAEVLVQAVFGYGTGD
jgi:hypothetical protein